jgi:hypothetical protein
MDQADANGKNRHMALTRPQSFRIWNFVSYMKLIYAL